MRRKVWLILMVLACLAFAVCGMVACGGDETGDERELTGIAITQAPDKTNYLVGEKFEPKGMVVQAKYSDNSTEAVTDYTYAPNGALQKTDTKITVTYQEKTATQTITVSDPPEAEVTKIEVTKKPTKLTYFVGDEFDKEGMEVTAYYDDGTSEVVTDYFLNVTKLEEEGEKEIVVTYGGMTAKFTVTVSVPALSSLEITAQPRWTLYNIGEKFDPKGMEVTAKFENNTQKVLKADEYTYEDKELTAADTSVEISYEVEGVKKSASVTITVKELVLSSIRVEQQPYNTEYSAGDKFDRSGLVVYAEYNNTTTDARVIDGWTIDDEAKALKEDSASVTVRYQEHTASISITILPKYIFEAEAVEFEVPEGADTTKLAISRGMEYGNVKSIASALPENVNWNMVSGTGFLNAAYSDVDVNAFVLNVTAAAAGKATILFRVAARPDLLTVGQSIPLKSILTLLEVNGAEIAVDEHSAYSSDLLVSPHFDMKELVAVRNVDLKQGNNVIKFNYTLKAVNVDYIAIRSSTEVKLTAEKDSGHSWSEWLVTTVPTAEKAGEMYRYCPTCFSREVVTLPANLDGSDYTKGESRAATNYLAGTQTYTYDGKTFTIVTEQAKGNKANNVFDLEDAEFDESFNAKMGIPIPGMDSAVNAKGKGAHKFNVGGGGDNGGGRFTFKVYAGLAATANFGVHVARNNTRVLNAAFNFRISVNGKPVALDPNMHCGTQDGKHNSTAEAYAKETEGWSSNGGNWKDWIYIVCGTFDLKEGENVIVVDVLGSPFTNVDDIRLQAATELATSADKVVTGVQMTKGPEKTEYYEGERFDPKGIELEATLKDGSKRPLTTFTYSPAGELEKGEVEITIEAEGKTVSTVTVTVKEVTGDPTELKVQPPQKLTYREGEEIDRTGMVVTAYYENGSRVLGEGDYQVEVGKAENGKATVTVSFSNVTATFEITILTRNIFEAEAFEAEDTKDLRRDYEYKADHAPSGMGYAARPQGTGTYTFHAYNASEGNVTAEVVFNFGQKKSVADAFSKLTVNGTEIPLVNETVNVSGYYSWTETGALATVTLQPGDNVFVLTIGKSRVNFDYVALYSEATLLPASCKDGHHFSDWNLYQEATAEKDALAYRYCPDCMTREELSIPYSEFTQLVPVETDATEYVRGTKTYTYNGMNIVVTKDGPTKAMTETVFEAETYAEKVGSNIYGDFSTGNANEADYVDVNNKAASFSLKFNADQKATVKLVIRAGAIDADLYLAYVFHAKLNGNAIALDWGATLTKVVTDDPRGGKWSAWDDVVVAEFEVEAGENTIDLSILGATFTRVDSFKLLSAATITAVTAE